MNTQPTDPANASRAATLEKVAHVLGIFFATFETIVLHSTLSGQFALGAIQALLILGGGLFFVLTRIRSTELRRAIFARVALSSAAVAVICGLALSGKLAELRGIDPTAGPQLRTVLLLVFQLGWALTFWLEVVKKRQDQFRYVPAAIGTVLLLGGGLLVDDGESVPEATKETNGVVFKQFATAEDFPFATETRRVGEERGAAFAHYHTGRRPLVGLSFDTQDWFGRTRISNLTGVFQAGADAEGTYRIEGRPGYVVATVEVQADDHVNALRVEFAPFDGEFLLPDGWYWSEWAGSHELHGPTVRLDGGIQLVVGLRGASGMVLNSLSLLTADPPSQGPDE